MFLGAGAMELAENQGQLCNSGNLVVIRRKRAAPGKLSR